MPTFTAQTGVNQPGLDLFSGFGKISASTVSILPAGFRIRLSATETVDVAGTFTFAGGVPTGGTIMDIQIAVSDTPIYQLTGLTLPWATAIGYAASQAAALAAWPSLLSGDDVLAGSSFADSMMGYAGKDEIDGGGGVDTVIYTDKTLAVSVTLNGATAATVSVGGIAEDTLRNIENVTGGSGNDVLTGDSLANALAGEGGDDLLAGADGQDVLDGGTGIDTALFTDKTLAVVVTLNGATNAIATVGGMAEDTLRNIENVTGGTGNDTLVGDLLGNVLDGGSGDDILAGLGGKDTLDGGTGIDTALFTDKTVAVVLTLAGATNATAFVGGVAEDTLRNVENVTSGTGADTLTGDGLANILSGGAGNDLLSGRGGDDWLDGGTGIDTADYADKTVAVRVTLNGATDAVVTVASVDEDTIRNIENLVGGSAGDSLAGDALDNTLTGGAGDDLLMGGGGDDLLAGQGDKDTLDGQGGLDTATFAEKALGIAVTLNGATDATVFVGGIAEDTLRNIENVIGGTGADLLTGDGLDNRLTGGAGNDVLDGRGGRDALDGGVGGDTALYSDKAQSVVVSLNGATDAVVSVGGVAEDTLRNVENVTGGSGGDILTGDALVNILSGADGDDILTGGAGADVIDGGTGSDTVIFAEKTLSVALVLNGSANATVLVGGQAEDTVRDVENVTGGQAADILTGDALANTLVGGGGDDILRGGDGLDRVDGGTGIDTALFTDKILGVSITLNGGVDAVATIGGKAEDTLRNVENLVGGGGADILTGDGLANLLDGGAGADSLNGGTGDDRLVGGAGADMIDGGAGIDTAFYTGTLAPVVVRLDGATAAIVQVGGVAEDTVRDVENLVGGDGGDGLTGDGLTNVLDGALGDDVLNGGLGDDVLIGGAGADRLDGAGGTDTASYAEKLLSVSVTLNGATQAVVNVGGTDEDIVLDVENIIGGLAADALTGDTLVNVLDGGAGDDVLMGRDGQDVLDGGLGNDTASYADKTDTVSVVLNAAANVIVKVDGVTEDTIRDIENIVGGSAGDTLTGDLLANRLNGGDGDDVLQGMAGADRLDGGAGTDTAVYTDKVLGITLVLNASADATVTVGSLAEDTIRAIENVRGGGADDSLTGDALANRLEGMGGNDLIAGMGGLDVLDGGAGIDTASYADKTAAVVVTLANAQVAVVTVGGIAEDTIVNFENLVGGSDADLLTGDTLANRLDGGAGADTLAGGDGDDLLIGGEARDTLDGGTGNDTASYLEKALSVAVVLAQDTFVTVTVGGVSEDSIRDIENLAGGAGDDSLTGDSVDNAFLGSGGRDTLNGADGSDTALYTDKTLSVSVTLNAATAASVLVGGIAEDTLRNIENVTGGSGSDILTGDTLVNTLIGGAGDDVLKGAGGQDMLDGGIGIDTALFTDKTTAVVVTLNTINNVIATVGGVNDDTLRNIENVTGGSGDDILTGDIFANLLVGGEGNDILKGAGGQDVLDGGTGIDTAQFTDKTIAVVVTLAGASNAIATVGGAAEDTLRNIENVTGGTGNDVLTGDGVVNTLLGGQGDDVLAGGGAADLLDGGAGIDTASFADKTVSVVATLDGTADVTAMVGGVAEDTLRGFENLTGGSAADTLTGDAQANTLDGGGGDDLLVGGEGDDLLIGRANKDSLDGGTGIDTASYLEKTTAVSVVLNGSTDAVVTVGTVAEDTVRNVENVIGGSAADVLTGDALANRFTGGGGNDALDGAGGIDTAVYSDKTLAVSVTLNGATAAVVTVNGVAEDTLRNIENVVGGSAADTLTGDALANALFGGLGDDMLSGAGGNDLIDGGDGIDTVSFADKTAGVSLVLDGANAATVFVGGLAEDAVLNVENVIGGKGADTLTGDSRANAISGGNGDDVLMGAAGLDRLDGGAGLDTAVYSDKTLAVAVTLNGAAQVSLTVNGGAEDLLSNIENLVGGGSADTLTGDSLANVLQGGGGKDVLDGAGGIDTVVYDDKLLPVMITLNGGTYATVTVGGVIEDTIRDFENVVGGDGADVITGDAFANSLWGGLGDDTLAGGGGDDLLDGGAGINTAAFVGKAADYAIAFGTSESKVTGAEGTATLRNIQYLQFADVTLPVSSASEFSIAATSASKAEGQAGVTPFTFTVTRSGNLSKAQTVAWSTKGMTATGVTTAAKSDFDGSVLPSGTLNFAVGESSKTITIGVVGDQVGESKEGFMVTLTNPTAGATIGTAAANGLILNDDTSLTVTALTPSAQEGDAGTMAFAFRISRAGDLSGQTTVNWATIGGYVDAADFAGGVLPRGTITFAAGDIAKRFNVVVAGDTKIEADEPFAVTLYGATGGATIATPMAQAIILNDDAIVGTAGPDTMVGTLGNDLFLLTGGDDTVIGSAGLDQFRFLPGALGGTVTLTDFDRSLNEVIDLAGIDAIAGTLADDAFTFIGQAAFGGVAGELRWLDSGGSQAIQCDVNGDRIAELVISTTAGGPVTADWFRL